MPENPEYDGYQKGLVSILYSIFDKKSALFAQSDTLATRDKSASGVVLRVKLCQTKNKQRIIYLLLENLKNEKYTNF